MRHLTVTIQVSGPMPDDCTEEDVKEFVKELSEDFKQDDLENGYFPNDLSKTDVSYKIEETKQ